MRIDAAVQFCLRSRFRYPWMQQAPAHMQRDFTPEDLWRILSRNKYEGAIVSAAARGEEETAWLLDLAASTPWIVGVIGETPAPSGKLCAVRLTGSCSRDRLRELEARGLACDVDRVDDLARIADVAPGLHLALAHMGRPNFATDFDQWAKAMEAAAAIPRLMIKISGLINDAGAGGWKAETYRPYIQHLLRVFGEGRLMYGSDWPNCMHTGTWKESLAAFTQALGAQTMETRDQILGGNALRHYRITLID